MKDLRWITKVSECHFVACCLPQENHIAVISLINSQNRLYLAMILILSFLISYLPFYLATFLYSSNYWIKKLSSIIKICQT